MSAGTLVAVAEVVKLLIDLGEALGIGDRLLSMGSQRLPALRTEPLPELTDVEAAQARAATRVRQGNARLEADADELPPLAGPPRASTPEAEALYDEADAERAEGS